MTDDEVYIGLTDEYHLGCKRDVESVFIDEAVQRAVRITHAENTCNRIKHFRTMFCSFLHGNGGEAKIRE